MTVDSTVPYDTISQMSVSRNGAFSKCCFCVPLRIGCFILGYMNLFYNLIQTLCVISLTAIVGLDTNGFDYINTEKLSSYEEYTRMHEEDQMVVSLAWLLLLVSLITVAWLAVNIACLVGLHKKRPGPVKVYVSLATCRLIMASLAFCYLLMTGHYMTTNMVLSHSIDIGLSAYFILVYYIYANQLERERVQSLPITNNDVAHDISFIYPAKLDKQHLVLSEK